MKFVIIFDVIAPGFVVTFVLLVRTDKEYFLGITYISPLLNIRGKEAYPQHLYEIIQDLLHGDICYQKNILDYHQIYLSNITFSSTLSAKTPLSNERKEVINTQ